jgi:hypothetical protein
MAIKQLRGVVAGDVLESLGAGFISRCPLSGVGPAKRECYSLLHSFQPSG